eukprot:330852-Chlamydomonas_euryale.AAC.2
MDNNRDGLNSNKGTIARDCTLTSRAKLLLVLLLRSHLPCHSRDRNWKAVDDCAMRLSGAPSHSWA